MNQRWDPDGAWYALTDAEQRARLTAAQDLALVAAATQPEHVPSERLLKRIHQLLWENVPDAPGCPALPTRFVGHFRTAPGDDVWFGPHKGTASVEVEAAVRKLCKDVRAKLGALDEAPSVGPNMYADYVSIWARFIAELVRIHPFAAGNGRTSRIMLNALVCRRGVPGRILSIDAQLPIIRASLPDGYVEGLSAWFRGDTAPLIGYLFDLLDPFVLPACQ